jgi:hypothetical protein
VIARLTDGSVCPTLLRKRFRLCGAGAFACQPIFSPLPEGEVAIIRVLGRKIEEVLPCDVSSRWGSCTAHCGRTLAAAHEKRRGRPGAPGDEYECQHVRSH